MNRRTATHLLAQRYPGGIDALAAAMGKRPDTLRKELTGVAGYKFGTDEEDMIMDLSTAANVPDAIAPLTAACANRSIMLVPFQTEGATAPSFERLAKIAREFGEFAQAMSEAHADGSISANDLKRLDKEGGDVVAAIQACLTDARRQHDAEKPAHLRAVGA